MARKTIPLADLVDKVNSMLLHSHNDAGRQALCVLLEGTLQDADQYHGFQFIDETDHVDLDPTFGPDDPRHSRRRYYGPR